MKIINSYAKQVLVSKGIKIYHGAKRILAYPKKEKYFHIKKEKPSFITGTPFIDDLDRTEIIKEYGRLKQLGLMIVSIPIKEGWFPHQKIKFAMTELDESQDYYGKIPKDHHAEFKPYTKQVRLVGGNVSENGYGDWIELPKTFIPGKKEHYLKKYFIKQKSSEKQRIYINEIPWLVLRDGRLLCLPKTVDMPRIAIVGTTGQGKTWMMHYLIDMLHHVWGHRVIIMQDDLFQFDTWARPNNSKKDISRLNMIGMTPKPLPIVFVQPVMKYMSNLPCEKDGLTVKFSVPYKSIIRNHYYFLQKKDWQLGAGASTELPNAIQKERPSIKNFDDFEDFVRGHFNKDNFEGEEWKSMRSSILRRFTNIHNENIMDISNGIIPKLVVMVKTFEGWNKTEQFPLLALANSGVIPDFVTIDLISKDYYGIIIRWNADLVMGFQSDDLRTGTLNPIWLAYDELSNLKSLGLQSFKRLMKQGRMRGIGLLFNEQDWTKLSSERDNSIPNNTLIGITTGFQSNKELTRFAKDFGLSKSEVEMIKNLERFEVGLASKIELVVYDENGKKTKEKGFFIGRGFPPLSKHKPPMQEVQTT